MRTAPVSRYRGRGDDGGSAGLFQMGQCCRRQIEHGENICGESPLELLLGNVLHRILWMLFGGIADKNVELSEFLHRLRYRFLTCGFRGKIAFDQQALTAISGNQIRSALRILRFLKKSDGYIGTFPCVGDCDRPAYA